MTFFLTAFTALFSIVDPPGVIPIFIAMTDGKPERWIRTMALKAALYMCGILLTFMFFGTEILHFFGISVDAMRIAGGIMITMSGLSLLRSNHEEEMISKDSKMEGKTKIDISFTPLAMPLLSGPGAIALVIGLYSKAENPTDVVSIIAAILSVCFIAFLILISCKYIVKLLGKSGIESLTKITGFLVLAIGIQFIVNAIKSIFFPHL